MNAIETRELTKAYKDVTAVDRLTLKIAEGELFSLLGINGAGKTTTVKMLSCISTPTSGDAILCGKSITKEGLAVKEMIGVSPQETAIAPNLTVKENLEFICRLHEMSRARTDDKIEELAEKFGLVKVLGKRAGKLSGGYQRRVSIAMAIANEPKILFLDEPTLGIDVIARSELWSLIKELKGKTTIILTTHYMEEAEALSDRLGVMKDGRMIFEGSCGELKEKSGKDRIEDAFIAIIKEEER